jgi:hypothetical protein
MRNRSSPDRARLNVARLVALLAMAAALWASQSLALVHQLAHEPGHAHAGKLFAHHDDDPSQCRLVDQLAHLAPLAAAPVLAHLDVAGAPVAVRYASRPTGPAAEGYLARAPPGRA